MKFLGAVRNTLVLAAVVLLNSVVIAGHASATSMMHDNHNGSHHSMNSKGPACISLCTTATLKDKEEANLVFEEQDDEPQPSFHQPYGTLNSDFVPKKVASSYVQSYPGFRPPDLVKLYSNYRF